MRRLLIFVKEPIPGQVKTRLAAEIGADAACQVYRRCVERTLERLSMLRNEITLCIEPADATGRIQAWLGAASPPRRGTSSAARMVPPRSSAWPVLPQCGVTLGERMAQAIDRAFKEGVRRVAVIGTDSPWIDHALIEEAFSAMERADLVLGPAADGGYYLVGLAKPTPELFRGIPWSTDQVLNQTLAAARRLGIVVSSLHPGYDIDRLEDVRQWMDSDPCHGVTVPIPATCGVTRTARPSAHRARRFRPACFALRSRAYGASEEVGHA